MPSSDLKFEIGHVILMDIVGYSKLVIDQPAELIGKLQEITRNARQFCLKRAGATKARSETPLA